jgi:hypothetical protein
MNNTNLNLDEKKLSSRIKAKKAHSQITWEEVDNALERAKVEFLREAKIEIEKQVQTDKASLITVFGIFASILSFLTIEFQFLKAAPDAKSILGLSLVLFASLFGFNIALDYLVKNRLDKDNSCASLIFTIFTIFLFIFGCIVIMSAHQ